MVATGASTPAPPRRATDGGRPAGRGAPAPGSASRAGERTVRRLWLGVVGYVFCGFGLVARFAFDATDLLLAGPGPLLLFLAVGVVGTLAAVFGGEGRESASSGPPGRD